MCFRLADLIAGGKGVRTAEERPGSLSAFAVAAVFLVLLPVALAGCGANAGLVASEEAEPQVEAAAETADLPALDVADVPSDARPTETFEEGSVAAAPSESSPSEETAPAADDPDSEKEEPEASSEVPSEAAASEEPVVPEGLYESFRPSLSHGPKPAEYQKYIVLHDTEGGGTPLSVIDWWDSNGTYVAAHFVIGKDGSIVQCVPLDEIAHHAGFGDAGHNDLYGIAEDGRDDMVGTSPIGDWAPDYAMNAWSVGIEMIHVGGEGDYPEAQLRALDSVIRYIDGFFGVESEIIDHKAWRSGNSDTSAEFAPYFANYQDHRTHD